MMRLQCYFFIGKGGGSIREINNISGARVNIERNTDCGGPETLRTITLMGTQAQIQLAVVRKVIYFYYFYSYLEFITLDISF